MIQIQELTGVWLSYWIATTDLEIVITEGIPGELVSPIIKKSTRSHKEDAGGIFFNLSDQ